MNYDRKGASNWGKLVESGELERLTDARIGRLATIGGSGFPTVVPVCFGLLDQPEAMLISVLDEKPKQVSDANLGRVRNIQRHPEVGLTVDHYEENWQQLWFIQLRGRARVIDTSHPLHAVSISALRAKYRQYRSMHLENRLVIVIGQLLVKSWQAEATSSED